MNFFLRYIEDSTENLVEQSNSPLLRIIHQQVETIRKSKEMEVEYMTLLSRYEEIAEEAAEEATEETKKITALNMLKDQMPISKISQYLNVPVETIQSWKEEIPE